MDRNRNWFLGILPVILVAVTVFLFSFYIASSTIQRVELETKANLVNQLESHFSTVEKALLVWEDQQKNQALLWANEEETRQAILDILSFAASGHRSASELLANPNTVVLRNHLKPVVERQGYIGYVVTALDGLNVAALLDEPLGKINLYEKDDFLQRAFAGDTVVSLPFKSSILLPSNNSDMEKDMPTMFVASPVKDYDGTIVAVLSFRIRPLENFMKIISLGRFGRSGEVYAISQEGLMLSESRFTGQLASLGLVERNSMLNIHIKDPGGNLLLGYKPALKREEMPPTRMAASISRKEGGIDLEGYNDYRGVSVVGIWKWIDGWGLGIAMEIDKDEIYTHLATIRGLVIKLSMLAVFLAVSVATIIMLALRLREREERFRNQIEAAADAMLILEANKVKIVDANPAASRLFGYNPEDIIGKSLFDFFPSSQREHIVKKIRECHSLGKCHIIGENIINRSNEPVAVDIVGNSFKLKDKLSFLQISIRNSTDLRRIERLEEVSSEINRLLIEDKSEIDMLSAICCFIVQEGGGYPLVWAGFIGGKSGLEVNPVVYAGADNLNALKVRVGQTPEGFGPTDKAVRSGTTQIVQNMESNADYRPWVNDLIRHNLASLAVFPLFHGESCIGALNVYSSEPTAFGSYELTMLEKVVERISHAIYHIRAKEEKNRLMKKLEDLARFPAENPNPVMRFSANGKILFCNQGGQPVLDEWKLKEGDDLPPNWKSMVISNCEKGMRLVFEERIGEVIYNITCEPNKKTEYMNAYFVDFTERRKAEEGHIFAKKVAEDATKLKDKFVSLVTHDLNESLHGALGYLTCLRESDIGAKSEALRDINAAEKILNRMTLLIKNVLNASRLSSGHIKPQLKQFDFRSMVDNVLFEIERFANDKKIRLEVDVPSEQRLFADETLMAEVLRNLLTNAIKYSAEGHGVVRIASFNGGFTVSDNGVGIPREKTKNLFNYENSLSILGTKGEKGTGYGLAISHEIVEKHNGVLTFASKPGEGTEFRVELPALRR